MTGSSGNEKGRQGVYPAARFLAKTALRLGCHSGETCRIAMPPNEHDCSAILRVSELASSVMRC